MPGRWPEILAAKNGVYYQPAGLLVTVNGTGSADPFLDQFPNFPGMLGRALEDIADGLWIRQPVGYPALVFPMRQSYLQGVDQAVDDILRHERTTMVAFPHCKIALSGYSQGALVTDTLWRDEFLHPTGRLHHLLDRVVCIVNWGDPMRAPGICRGNELAGFPVPGKLDGHTTGGIAGPNCLTAAQTPDFLYSRNNITDLYGSAPVGDDPWHKETQVGHDERLVYEAVMDFDGSDVMAWIEEFAKVLTMPLTHVVPLFDAILNGMRFVGSGFAGHGAYEIEWAVRHLIELGTSIRAQQRVA